MWADKRLIDCPRCGHRMYAEVGARFCDACMVARADARDYAARLPVIRAQLQAERGRMP